MSQKAATRLCYCDHNRPPHECHCLGIRTPNNIGGGQPHGELCTFMNVKPNGTRIALEGADSKAARKGRYEYIARRSRSSMK